MPHQELYNKLFNGKGNSNPKELLQNITTDYPYFSIAHFFLLKETAASDLSYRKTAARTALHFNNPYLLKYQLDRKFRPVPVIETPVAATLAEQIKPSQPAETTKLVDPIELVERIEKLDSRTGSDKSDDVKKEEGLLFEPLYTTDYFASQGIKLSEEAQSSDKLGKQLKSFTDWLKTMKKTHQGKLPQGSASIDLAVQSLAEKSNAEQEILTESMAEIFIQQGKIGKAQEIYKKLSLLNPAKSAYFAAKIELLKEN